MNTLTDKYIMPYGKLVIAHRVFECARSITFRDKSLSISGLNVCKLYYYRKETVPDLSPFGIRDFETDLLNNSHSFEYEGLKEFVEKFNLNKDFPRIFNMTVSLNDSENSYFTVSIFYDSTIAKQTYVFEVNGEKAKYFSGVYSWKLRVDADGDVLVSALSCVYFLTECVKNRNFSYVPVYMDMLAGLLA